MPILARCATILGTGLFLAAPALAQEDAVNNLQTPPIVAELFNCREIADADDRLACFDREVDRVYQAQATKELVITDREQIKETRKGLFGFSLPKIGIFQGEDDEVDEIDELAATLSDAREMSNGRYMLTLETGARWMQVDKIPVFGNPGAGDTVVIEKGTLGTYFAKIGKRRAFKVKRVD